MGTYKFKNLQLGEEMRNLFVVRVNEMERNLGEFPASGGPERASANPL